jgi:adenylate kinase family enzyme
MQRVVVLGSSGAGKSTFARRLGAATGLPVVHIDQLFWRPGWVESEKDVYRARLAQAVAQPRWIIDGNYLSTIDDRLARADRVILLDRTRSACLIRIGRRIALSYGRVRPDMAEGCPEQIDWAFLKYVWDFPNTQWPQIIAALDRGQAWDRTATIKSDREADAFLNHARARPAAG